MRRKILGGLAFFAVVAGAALYSMSWETKAIVPVSAGLKLDLGAPDALVRSKGLSRLPADLLKIPLLHDLLTEDFVYYYEQSEARLSLKGTIRRLAYEHDANLTDELIKLVMDEPADVALWRGSKGELRYYVIAMTRNTLAKVLEPLAKIAMKDRQLRLAGELKVNGDSVQLFALEYAANRTMLLASHADRVVVFSDPSMVLNPDGNVKDNADVLLADLLGSDLKKQQRFAAAFDLDDQVYEHSIAVKANFLSFHYQKFFPALKAVRFDFGEKSMLGSQSWTSALLLDADPARAGSLMNGKPLWQALPHQAGACMTLPVDWRAVTGVMDAQQIAGVAPEQFSALFDGPAAVCWYAQSRLHSPLFVAQLNSEGAGDKILGDYFNFAIHQAGETDKPDPVKVQKTPAGDELWQGVANTDQMQPALARSGKLVYFSPDGELVKRALAVAHKQQPAVSDRWKWDASTANTVAMFGPEPLAQLAEHEIDKSLPRQQDALLRDAADQHLIPKLAAVKKYPPLRVEMHSTPKGAGWVELDWLAF